MPTILDMPPVRIELLEHADPDAPYGLKGVGEPPTISTPPAVAAALRDATGRELPRVPLRPEHIAGLSTAWSPDDLDAMDEAAFVARSATWPSTRPGSREPRTRTGRSAPWPSCRRARGGACGRPRPTTSSP